MRRDRSDRSLRNFRFAFAFAEIILLGAWLTIGLTRSAQALPSFARQTGQPCGTCHTSFPGLTPFGRRFKLLGYTTGGGLYKTTPFSNNAGPNEAYASLRNYATSVDGDGAAGQRAWVPPISMMATPGFTNLTVPQPADPFAPNNNITIPPLKLEYDYYGFGTKSLLFTDTTIAMTNAPANINQNIQVVLLGVNFHARSGPDW